MRNYCRYLFTIFLMLPVLVCATSFIFVTQDKAVDIVPDDSSYGDKIHLEPYSSTVVDISNETNFRIGTAGAYVKVTKSGASYSTETSGDIGVYKANVLMPQTTDVVIARTKFNNYKANVLMLPTKFRIPKDVNLVISTPKVTRTVTKESEIKDANNIFVIADRQGEGKKNMYQQLQAGMMASGVYCEFSKTNSDNPNYISNLITEIDNFYNAIDRINYLSGTTKPGSKKITLVVDFDQNSTNPQNHIEQIKTWVAALINGVKNKGQIKKVVFLSHTKEDDDAVIKAVGRSVKQQKDSILTPFPISHIQESGGIQQMLKVSFSYNRLGQKNQAASTVCQSCGTPEGISELTDMIDENSGKPAELTKLIHALPACCRNKAKIIQSHYHEAVKLHKTQTEITVANQSSAYAVPNLLLSEIAASISAGAIATENPELQKLENRLAEKQSRLENIQQEISSLQGRFSGLTEPEKEDLKKKKKFRGKLESDIEKLCGSISELKSPEIVEVEEDSDDEYL